MSAPLLLLLSGLAHADAAPLPTAQISWRHSVASASIVAPPGEHLAPEAPVTGWFRVDSGIEFGISTDGAAIAKGLWVAVPEAGTHSLAMQLRLSLCQDKGTACRVVDLALVAAINGKKGSIEVVPHAPVVPEATALAEAPLPSVEQAQAEAGATGKLVLVDFATPWCPPCNLLAAEVLHDPADAEALAPFVLTRIDADEVASWPIKTRYHVGGYPTVVAIRPDGVEVDRLVGYPGQDATLRWLAGLPSQTPLSALPAPEAMTSAQALDAALRFARANLESKAAPYLARLTPALAPELQSSPTLHLARFLAAPSAEEVRWLISASAPPAEWMPAAIGLSKDDASLRPALRTAIVGALQGANPSDAADLLWAAGTLAEDDHSPEATVLFAAGAASLRGALTGDAVADRGYWTTLADLYASAGDLDAAQRVLQDAITAWPHEFTYLNAMAGLLEENKRPADALPFALGALSTSYGDTRLRAVARCARLLRDLGKPAEALQLIEDTLAAAPRPGPDDDVRTTRYLKTLEDLRAALSAPPPAATPAKADKKPATKPPPKALPNTK